MTSGPDLVVLVRSLSPSPELDDVVELLAWLRARDPAISAPVVAIEDGSGRADVEAVTEVRLVDATVEARAGRVAQRARLRVPARAARSRGVYRLLGEVTVPVLVTASAGRYLNWLGPSAGPVVGRLPEDGPALDQLDAPDRAGLADRVDAWATGPRLHRQAGDRDDEPDLRARRRSSVATDLGIAPERPLVVLLGAEHAPVPSDSAVRAAWDLVEAGSEAQLVWTAPSLTARAATGAERQVADAGLAGRLLVAPGAPWWPLAATADAVVVEGGAVEGIEQVARGRVVCTAPASAPSELASAVAAVLPGGSAWLPADDRWHVAVGGPPILALLGVTPPPPR